ncbi:hypothetical protein NQ318_002601 [Aromia moschata]|uniref:Uncharacterized protein n=1 Tax=Aromia moschata TaxID=1265417 RepID=A0AAV8XX11_9CUCU|nr:hypothetical protein NQ318_002601 [Aromia moschata]
MIQNVRDCKDIHYVYDLTLTLIQYCANPDLSLNMSEAIKNHPLHAQSIWKTKNYILYYYIMLISRKENLITDPNMSFGQDHHAVLPRDAAQAAVRVPQDTAHAAAELGAGQDDRAADVHHQGPVQEAEESQADMQGEDPQQLDRPGLYINKLNLPNQLKDYLLNFQS